MKTILITLILLGTLQAQDLTLDETLKTLNYSHSISAKMRYKRLLKRVAIVKKDEAYKIAEKSCKSEVEYSKLIRHGNRLFYAIRTASCRIKIDALDGSTISKKAL